MVKTIIEIEGLKFWGYEIISSTSRPLHFIRPRFTFPRWSVYVTLLLCVTLHHVSVYTTYYYYCYYHYHYMDVSCHGPFLPGTSLEPTAIPTAQTSSFTLQYFPYYIWCSKYYYYYYANVCRLMLICVLWLAQYLLIIQHKMSAYSLLRSYLYLDTSIFCVLATNTTFIFHCIVTSVRLPFCPPHKIIFINTA